MKYGRVTIVLMEVKKKYKKIENLQFVLWLWNWSLCCQPSTQGLVMYNRSKNLRPWIQGTQIVLPIPKNNRDINHTCCPSGSMEDTKVSTLKMHYFCFFLSNKLTNFSSLQFLHDNSKNLFFVTLICNTIRMVEGKEKLNKL